MKLRVIENGEERIHELQEHETLLTIGRAPECDIVLKENKSSRKHCQIRKTDEGYYIKDLDSSNGTIVNQEKIKDFKLTLGDKIIVGKAVIYFGEPEPIKIKPINSSFAKSKDILSTERRADIKTIKPKRTFFGVVKNIAIFAAVAFVALILGVVVMNIDMTDDENQADTEEKPEKKVEVDTDEGKKEPKLDVARLRALRDADSIIQSEDTVIRKEARLNDLLKRKERAVYYSEIHTKYENFLRNITDHLNDELERYAFESIDYIRTGSFSAMLEIYKQFRENYQSDPKYKFELVQDSLFEKQDYLTEAANDYFYSEIVPGADEFIEKQNWTAARQYFVDAKSKFDGFLNIQRNCDDFAAMIDNYIDVIKNGKYEKIPDDMISKFKQKTSRPRNLEKKDNSPKPSENKITENELLASLRQKLIDSINRVDDNYLISRIIYTDPNDKSTKFSIASADSKGIYDRKANALFWGKIVTNNPKLINELHWRIKRKDMQTFWAMATFNFEHDLKKEAAEVLAEIYDENKDLKGEIDAFMAKHLNQKVPEGGFIYLKVSGERNRIITPDEMQVIQNKKIIKKKVRDLKKDFRSLLRTTKEDKLAKINADIKEELTQIMNLGANTEIPELITMMREAMLEMAKKAKSGQGHITPALRQKLDAARMEALARINDKIRYPDENHGKTDANGEHGQPWVNEAVDKVKDLWEDPAYGQIDVILSQILSLFKDYIDIVDPKTQYHDPAEDQRVMDEVARQLEDDKVMRDNASAGPDICTSNEKAHVRIVNQYRIMLGLPALRINPKLCTAARRHAEYLKQTKQFAHNVPGHPDGETHQQRAAKQGYRGNVGENIAMNGGGHTPMSSFIAWYNSSGHHRNMVNRAWKVMGVGDAGSHWCQLFGGVADGSEPIEGK